MSTSSLNRPLAATIALLMALTAACGSTEEAVDEAASTASSALEGNDVTIEDGEELLESADLDEDLDEVTIQDLENAIGDEDVATLFTVLDVAGFDDIASAERFTFFAPNNGAFGALDAELLADLLEDPGALQDILRDHLIEDVVMAGDLPADGSVSTTGGLELTFDTSGSPATVNGIPIVRTDILVGDRGVVHVIDGLLLEE